MNAIEINLEIFSDVICKTHNWKMLGKYKKENGS
jgi:hypothetical protein